ncbi:MAG: AAA family ATPase, partial [Dokdonella sp.]
TRDPGVACTRVSGCLRRSSLVRSSGNEVEVTPAQIESNAHARTGTLPAPDRLIVAVMGLPGAGKSRVADALEKQLGLRRVCRDTIRHAMFPDCNYSYIEKRAAFRAVLLAVEINCLLGEASVIDGMTFSRAGDFESVMQLAKRMKFRAIALWIDCPPAIARDRIAADAAAARHIARDRVPALVDAVLARGDQPPDDAIRIDATQPIAAMCRASVDAVHRKMAAVHNN